MGEACGMQGGEARCTQVVGGETEGKTPPGRPMRRRECNIIMDLK